MRTGQVKWIKVLTAKVNDARSILGTYMIKGEDLLLASCPVTSTHVHTHTDSQNKRI